MSTFTLVYAQAWVHIDVYAHGHTCVTWDRKMVTTEKVSGICAFCFYMELVISLVICTRCYRTIGTAKPEPVVGIVVWLRSKSLTFVKIDTSKPGLQNSLGIPKTAQKLLT